MIAIMANTDWQNILRFQYRWRAAMVGQGQVGEGSVEMVGGLAAYMYLRAGKSIYLPTHPPFGPHQSLSLPIRLETFWGQRMVVG